MNMRKNPLSTKEVYHIFSKSIAEFRIFNNASELLRMINVIRYYQREKPVVKFSNFIKMPRSKQNIVKIPSAKRKKLVEIIAYCIMPTHLHLILKQLEENGISIFMNHILNSHARYFNIKYNRKGPLYEGRFKSIIVKNDKQLLHLTRYIHLNPVTAYLVDKPEEWFASSYKEYLSQVNQEEKICQYDEILEIETVSYKKFIEDRISFQRELAIIKGLLFK